MTLILIPLIQSVQSVQSSKSVIQKIKKSATKMQRQLKSITTRARVNVFLSVKILHPLAVISAQRGNIKKPLTGILI